MDFTPREVDEECAKRYVAEGFWGDQTVSARCSPRACTTRPITRSPCAPIASRTAARSATSTRWRAGSRPGCGARGIEPGDAVAFQLPNWLEAAATFYAIAYLGAVVVPIVHFYGPKEVGYILRKTRVKALVTADRFGHQDFLANLDGACATRLADLEWVAVVGDRRAAADRAISRSPTSSPTIRSTTSRAGRPDARPRSSRTRRARPSDPKGVVHAHRTINAEIRPARVRCRANRRRSARSHHRRAGRARHRHARRAAHAGVPPPRRSTSSTCGTRAACSQAMLEDDLSAGQGATFFLTSLLDHPDFDPERARRR